MNPGGELTRYGVGKSITITGLRKEPLPEILQPPASEETIRVEVHPHER